MMNIQRDVMQGVSRQVDAISAMTEGADEQFLDGINASFEEDRDEIEEIIQLEQRPG